MAKVFVVTTGSYSDETIERVFSTREKFEEWASEFKNYYTVYEHDLDDMSDKRHVDARLAVMDAFSGELVTINPHEGTDKVYFSGLPSGKNIIPFASALLSVVVTRSYVHYDDRGHNSRRIDLVLSALFPSNESKDSIIKSMADIRGQLFSNQMLDKPGIYNRTTLAPIYQDKGMFK